MNCKFLLAILCILPMVGNTQNVFWCEDVASIIYDNCSSCHHQGGIAPFELMSYEDAVLYADAIHHVTDERSMPPWPADPDYRHFVDEAYLEQSEIDLIHQWILEGTFYGDEDEEPAKPVFEETGSLLSHIDYTIEIEPYTLQSNLDEYRWFVVENPFDVPIFVDKIEVIPGLEEVVHHVDLFLDQSGQSLQFDLLDPLSGFNSSTGTPNNDNYINAWAPGGNITRYPENWGYRIMPNAEFVIEIHYGPGGLGLKDDTKLNLQFLDNPQDTRQVKASWLLNDSPPIMLDGPLVIPADEVVTFHQQSTPLSNPISVISICPHMHFLGKSYKVWVETLEGEIIPLIDIPHWDFHWQKYYTFQKIQVIPAGAVIKSEGSYDNTENNHDNPNIPPVTVNRGLKTTDEMFLCFFTFTDYRPGDEHIVMDSTLMQVTSIKSDPVDKEYEVFPNPTKDWIFLEGDLSERVDLTFRILNAKAQLMSQQMHTRDQATWQVKFDVSDLTPGIYFILWDDNGRTEYSRFIKL